MGGNVSLPTRSLSSVVCRVLDASPSYRLLLISCLRRYQLDPEVTETQAIQWTSEKLCKDLLDPQLLQPLFKQEIEREERDTHSNNSTHTDHGEDDVDSSSSSSSFSLSSLDRSSFHSCLSLSAFLVLEEIKLDLAVHTRFFLSAAEGRIDRLTQLAGFIDIGYTDEHGCTVLMVAAHHGQLAVVEYLSQLSPPPLINKQDDYGWTAVMHASRSGHLSLVKLLTIRLHADIHLINTHHANTLFIAAEAGHSSIVSHLIHLSADVNIVTLSGDTPLLCAVRAGHMSMVKELLSAGCEPDVCDSDHRSAVLLSALYSRFDLVELLVSHGCSIDCLSIHHETVCSFETPDGAVAAAIQRGIIARCNSYITVKQHRQSQHYLNTHRHRLFSSFESSQTNEQILQETERMMNRVNRRIKRSQKRNRNIQQPGRNNTIYHTHNRHQHTQKSNQKQQPTENTHKLGKQRESGDESIAGSSPSVQIQHQETQQQHLALQAVNSDCSTSSSDLPTLSDAEGVVSVLPVSHLSVDVDGAVDADVDLDSGIDSAATLISNHLHRQSIAQQRRGQNILVRQRSNSSSQDSCPSNKEKQLRAMSQRLTVSESPSLTVLPPDPPNRQRLSALRQAAYQPHSQEAKIIREHMEGRTDSTRTRHTHPHRDSNSPDSAPRHNPRRLSHQSLSEAESASSEESQSPTETEQQHAESDRDTDGLREAQADTIPSPAVDESLYPRLFHRSVSDIVMDAPPSVHQISEQNNHQDPADKRDKRVPDSDEDIDLQHKWTNRQKKDPDSETQDKATDRPKQHRQDTDIQQREKEEATLTDKLIHACDQDNDKNDQDDSSRHNEQKSQTHQHEQELKEEKQQQQTQQLEHKQSPPRPAPLPLPVVSLSVSVSSSSPSLRPPPPIIIGFPDWRTHLDSTPVVAWLQHYQFDAHACSLLESHSFRDLYSLSCQQAQLLLGNKTGLMLYQATRSYAKKVQQTYVAHQRDISKQIIAQATQTTAAESTPSHPPSAESNHRHKQSSRRKSKPTKQTVLIESNTIEQKLKLPPNKQHRTLTQTQTHHTSSTTQPASITAMFSQQFKQSMWGIFNEPAASQPGPTTQGLAKSTSAPANSSSASSVSSLLSLAGENALQQHTTLEPQPF